MCRRFTNSASFFDADFAERLVSQGWGHRFLFPGSEDGPGEMLVSRIWLRAFLDQFQYLSLM